MVSYFTPTYMLCIKEKRFKVIDKNRKINIEIQKPLYICENGEGNAALLL